MDAPSITKYLAPTVQGLTLKARGEALEEEVKRLKGGDMVTSPHSGDYKLYPIDQPNKTVVDFIALQVFLFLGEDTFCHFALQSLQADK